VLDETTLIACSLEQAEFSERGTQMAALGQTMVAVSVQRSEARLRFPLDRGPQIDALVAAESRCCPFFCFERRRFADEIELRVSAPADGAWAVRGLVAGFVAGWGAGSMGRVEHEGDDEPEAEESDQT
jgi:hypothetical protein